MDGAPSGWRGCCDNDVTARLSLATCSFRIDVDGTRYRPEWLEYAEVAIPRHGPDFPCFLDVSCYHDYPEAVVLLGAQPPRMNLPSCEGPPAAQMADTACAVLWKSRQYEYPSQPCCEDSTTTSTLEPRCLLSPLVSRALLPHPTTAPSGMFDQYSRFTSRNNA